MTQPELDSIVHLNWDTIQCQCPCHQCRDEARYIVAIHALHCCDSDGLDEDGNRIQLRCEMCVAVLKAEIEWKLLKLNEFGRAKCESCGAPIFEVFDVLRWEKKL